MGVPVSGQCRAVKRLMRVTDGLLVPNGGGLLGGTTSERWEYDQQRWQR